MKKLLPLLLPAAVVLLGSCSSEPSDWRPEKKVSLDMIPPGTRPTDNFDQGTNEAPSNSKGGAIATPISSNPRSGHNTKDPAAASVMSSDTQAGTAQDASQSGTAKQGNQSANAMPDTAVGQANQRRK